MKRETNKIKKSLLSQKDLSEREVEVFFTVGSGKTNAEAAEFLKVSEGTVKFHLTNIFKKVNAVNRQHLVLMAHGLRDL